MRPSLDTVREYLRRHPPSRRRARGDELVGRPVAIARLTNLDPVELGRRLDTLERALDERAGVIVVAVPEDATAAALRRIRAALGVR